MSTLGESRAERSWWLEAAFLRPLKTGSRETQAQLGGKRVSTVRHVRRMRHVDKHCSGAG